MVSIEGDAFAEMYGCDEFSLVDVGRVSAQRHGNGGIQFDSETVNIGKDSMRVQASCILYVAVGEHSMNMSTDPLTRRRCSKDAKHRDPLKGFARRSEGALGAV